MKIKDAYIIACNNIKGRKRIGKILSAIIFVALFVFMLVNSLSSSTESMVDRLKEMPISKTLVFVEGEYLPKDYMDKFSALEHVVEIVDYWKLNADAVFENRKGSRWVDVVSYTKSYEDYLMAGNIPKENEILIPHYINVSSKGTYEDCSKYIGQKVTVYIENNKEEKKAYTYTVSGTYDNIYAELGQEIMLVQPSDSMIMKEYSYIGWEERLQERMELTGNYDPNSYGGFEPINKYAIVVDEFENVSRIQDTLYNKYMTSSSTEINPEQNDLSEVLDVAIFISVVITIMLLAIVIILMVMTVGNDIRARKKEMAIYMIQGYTRKDLVKIIGVEYAIRFAPVLAYVTILTCALMIFANWVVDTFLSVEYEMLKIYYSVDSFVIGAILLIIVLANAVRNISQQINEINLLKEIRAEG